MPWCIERENTTIPLKFLNGLQLQNRSKLLLTSLAKKNSREINAKLANPTDGVCTFSFAIVRHDTSWQHRPQGFLVFRYGGHIGKRQDAGDEISKDKLGQASCKPEDALRCCPIFSSFPTATKTLTFKTRESAKSLWCKCVLFA